MNLLQYFNTPEVRKALHVNEKLKEVTLYSQTVYDNYQRTFESSNWIYDILAKYGYRMLHITGNVDGVVTQAGTWKWIKKRNFTVKTHWTPWIS